MTMTQKDISAYITYQLQRKGFHDLRGKMTEVYLDESEYDNVGNRYYYKRYMGNLSAARKIAKEGDRIVISIYTKWHDLGDVFLTIKNDRHAIGTIHTYNKEAAKSNIRDFQRQRVYNWERRVRYKIAHGISLPKMSINEVDLLYNRLCNWYNLPPLTIKFKSSKTTTSHYYTSLKEVRLARAGTHLFTVIHEFAHHLHAQGVHRQGVAHGAEFVSWLIDVYCLAIPEYYPELTSKDVYELMIYELSSFKKVKHSLTVLDIASKYLLYKGLENE